MNNIIFLKGEGGLGRKALGEDHYSGLIFYSGAEDLPTGWDTEPIQEINSVTDLEAKGITATTTEWEIAYYHITEFFRQNAAARLFVMLKIATPSDYAEIKTLQNFAGGKLRQIGVYDNVELLAANVTALQAIAEDLEAVNKPCSIIWQPDISQLVLDSADMIDLRALASPKVSVVIGQDGAATGKSLFETSTGKTVGCLGAILGAISRAGVHENIAWIEKFNLANIELETPAFGEGSLVSAISDAVLNTLNTKGYIFVLKHVGIAGTYFNDSHAATAITSDYAYLENNRTMDKAIRNVRTALLPSLNRPVTVDPSTGQLALDIVKFFESTAYKAVEQMISDGELSGGSVYINPDQDVLSTSTITIQITLVIKGVARTININIQFGRTA